MLGATPAVHRSAPPANPHSFSFAPYPGRMSTDCEEAFDALRASDMGGRPNTRAETQTSRTHHAGADRRRPRQTRTYSSDVRGFAANRLRRGGRDGRRSKTHAVALLDVREGAPASVGPC